MTRIEKTVFISYRRKDISWALAIYQYLINHDYDVFFDYTSISSGAFEQIIISNIKARAHFLVILTPNALDRCNEAGDWLRREVETAIDEKRNVIPIFFDGFSFSIPSVSERLTGKLAALKQYNGLEVPGGYFDAAMERLCNQYLNVRLNAVLHPLSVDAQEAVIKQQVAANRAILQQEKTDEKEGEEKEQSGEKPTHKLTFVPFLIGAIAVVVVIGGIFGVDYIIKNWFANESTPTEQTPVVSPSSTYTPRPVTTTPTENIPSPTAMPVVHIGSTWARPADGMVMMYVPAGNFIMGNDSGNDDEKPVHTVYLDALWIDKTEVTNKMYALCVASGICEPPDLNESDSRLFYYGNPEFDDYPVIYVSWNDASVYCTWAGEMIYDVRLPTEAEWEKAASWDLDKQEKRLYPWGNTFDCTFVNYRYCMDNTTKVGSYPSGASYYGVLDMAGNVWEWVSDWYSVTYYLYSLRENPTGPATGDNHVYRGNWWGNSNYLPTTTVRGFHGDPISSSLAIGFRCVRSEASP